MALLRGATALKVVTDTGRPTQAQWLADVTGVLTGATAHVDRQQSVARPAIVLDIDNTALQGYYQPFAAIVANVGNHATDLYGAGSGRTYLLPSYGFLDRSLGLGGP